MTSMSMMAPSTTGFDRYAASLHALEPAIRKLPTGLRDKAREAIRACLAPVAEKACEAAIDGSGATGDAAEAVKGACKPGRHTRRVVGRR